MLPASLRTRARDTASTGAKDAAYGVTDSAVSTPRKPSSGGASFFRHRVENAVARKSIPRDVGDSNVDSEIDQILHGGASAYTKDETPSLSTRLNPEMFGSGGEHNEHMMSELAALDGVTNGSLRVGTELDGDGWLRERPIDRDLTFDYGFYPESKALATSGLKSKVASSVRTMQSRAMRDRFAEVIDNARLVELNKLPGYMQRAQDVQKAAESLVTRVGIQNVVMLQLGAQSHVDHAGNLRGYTLVVNKTASVKPILETMPDYGAGRTVFTGIRDPKAVSVEADFSTSDARAVISRLFDSRRIVDFSDPANEGERAEAHAFLRTMAESGGDQARVVPENLAPGRVLPDSNNIKSTEAAGVRRAISRIHSLAQHGCSVALCKYAEDVSVVCDNYSQIVADLINYRMRLPTAFETVDDFLASPLPQMALDHGYAARAGVIVQVAKDVEANPALLETKKQLLSYTVQSNVSENDPWFVELDVPKSVAADQVHCYMRKMSSKDSEWSTVKQCCLDRLAAEDDEFGGDCERRTMLDTPMPFDYVIVFNDMTDAEYINAHKERTEYMRPAFSLDFGASRAFGVVNSSEREFKFQHSGSLLALPQAGVQPCDHATLIELIPEARKKRHTASVGYAAEFDPTEPLALLVSWQHTEREIRSIFQEEGRNAKAAVANTIRLRDLLHAHIAEGIDLSLLEALERHTVLFRWCSSVDPSLLTLSKRRSMITSNSELLIDARHKEQVREVLMLLLDSLERVERSDPLLKQLQNIVQPGTSAVNPDGVVLKLSSELTDRLLARWDVANGMRI